MSRSLEQAQPELIGAEADLDFTAPEHLTPRLNVMNLGPGEILLILVAALILFGPAKLPELGKSLGKGIREFRRGTQGLKDELEGSLKEEPARPAASQAQPAQVPATQTPMPTVQAQPEVHQTVYSAAPDAQPQPAPARASDMAVNPVVETPTADAPAETPTQTATQNRS